MADGIQSRQPEPVDLTAVPKTHADSETP